MNNDDVFSYCTLYGKLLFEMLLLGGVIVIRFSLYAMIVF